MNVSDRKSSFVNDFNTIGFTGIGDFKGQTTTINLENLQHFVSFLKLLNKMGFSEVKLGIENDSLLLMFLDKQQKTAFAIAPIMHDEDD